jgi:hypothetical protein
VANPLSGQELCAIIEACGKAGVRIVKLPGIYLVLGPRPASPASLAVAREAGPDHRAQNNEALALDELAVKEERMRMLMIEDPLEYERLLKDGELDESDADDPED